MSFSNLIKRYIPTGITKKMLKPILLFGTLVVLLATCVIYFVMSHYLYAGMAEQTANQTTQIVNVFEEQLNQLNMAVLTASNQTSIKSIINGSYVGYQEFTTSRDSYNHITLVNSLNKCVNMYIFVPERNYVMGTLSGNISSSFDIASSENTRGWYSEIQSEYISLHQRTDFVAPLTGGEPCFASLLTVHSHSNWAIKGIIVASLDRTFLDSLFENTLFANEGVFLVFDQAGNVAYASSGNKDEYKDVIDADSQFAGQWTNSHYIFRMDGNSSQFSFASMVDRSTIMQQVWDMCMILMTAMFAVLVLMLLLSYVLANSITRPIRDITKFTRNVESAKLTERLDIHSNDEIEEMACSFNSMLDSVQENQVLRRQAQLNALQKQIDPHFLFNTLETVKALAILNDGKSVYAMLQALGDMLKYNTNRNERSTTTLREELEHVRNYLYIQKIRFKDRLVYAICADESLLDCLTLKFILQPIVENSLHYAMEPTAHSFRLRINIAEMPGEKLRIDVVDNGNGIAEDRLEQIRAFINGDGEQGTFGIGLKNINQRIKLFFSDEYGVLMESKTGCYTKVSIIMPKRSV